MAKPTRKLGIQRVRRSTTASRIQAPSLREQRRSRAPRISEGTAEVSQTPTNPSVTSTYSHDEVERLENGEVGNFRPFNSSRVVEAAYDSDRQRLYVRFVKPVGSGTPWTYEGVPPNVWRNMRRTSSPGRFVNRVLNQYNYHAGRWE